MPQPDLAALADLGWSAFFADQLAADESGLLACRVATVHRARMTAIAADGPLDLNLPPHTNTGDFTVGDWVLADPSSRALHRRLDRRTVLERHVEGGRAPQLAGANIDTLFIVTSCNGDFNPARLERYLALANQAGTRPVIVLSKADLAADLHDYEQQAAALQRDLPVVALNGRERDAAERLAPWCGVGQTVALVGSSGVGKSTLVNTLVGQADEAQQQTGAVRQGDAKGRHTTTARSLHPMAGGGWVIDTPGIRTLNMGELAGGIDMLFAEITELAQTCKFRDCSHVHEPGCAVRAAIAAGTLDAGRLQRWNKLMAESRSASPSRPGKPR